MKSIFASKMFINSTRQAKICAAMTSPINVELVKQLQEYLDEEYIPAEPVHVDKPEKEAAPTPSTHTSSAPASGGPRGGGNAPAPSLSEKHGDDLAAEENDAANNAPVADIADTSNTETEPTAESATSTTKQSVMSSTCFNKTTLVTDIKGMMNVRADTAGATRVSFKGEDEMWIYYADDVNLNNILSQVIETINSAGLTYLEFNRLARSDNAVVFTFNPETTATVEPIVDNA